MSSSSDNFSLSSLSSERSGGSGSSQSNSSDREQPGDVGRITMETTVEVSEDPLEELAESNWPAKVGYEWVAADVRTQYSIFRWLRLLKSWLNCTPIFEKGAQRDIMVPERLHIRLVFDEFTMGVLRLLNVAPTQLHPNS
ncbi:hypothetical protein DEO72_LG8g1340 [Vigna unguiculata]|uniref:Uncharacterized protein n=1 Tax=Vigna unguiculata TaxID=3917 RepID=A0A4D6MPF9_VIGUN|nr:hypothetical protein DEO72_LG8g1340 [Vigna unguiculata]